MGEGIKVAKRMRTILRRDITILTVKDDMEFGQNMIHMMGRTHARAVYHNKKEYITRCAAWYLIHHYCQHFEDTYDVRVNLNSKNILLTIDI